MFRFHLSLNMLKLYTFPEHTITTYFLANISLALVVIPEKLSNTNLHPVIIFRKLPAVDDFLLVDGRRRIDDVVRGEEVAKSMNK